jgi:cysteine desulfurase
MRQKAWAPLYPERHSFSPFIVGGHQERGRRGGTENTASIIGLGKACQLALANMEDENTRVKDLRDKLEREILKRVPKPVSTAAGRTSAQYEQYQLRIY